MVLKVFISHKNVDSEQAIALQAAFTRNRVDTYLDVLDSSISAGGKELTDHIKQNLNSCTDILVVMSRATKDSWWVPFEVGMSAQIDMPTVSFLRADIDLPEYLCYWPRLRSTNDIDTYVAVRRRVEQQILHKNYSVSERRKIGTPEFYRQLKCELEKRY